MKSPDGVYDRVLPSIATGHTATARTPHVDNTREGKRARQDERTVPSGLPHSLLSDPVPIRARAVHPRQGPCMPDTRYHFNHRLLQQMPRETFLCSSDSESSSDSDAPSDEMSLSPLTAQLSRLSPHCTPS